MGIGEWLVLIALWCEQTHADLWEIHDCRKELLTCVYFESDSEDEQIKCLLHTPEPDAEAL